MSCSLTFVVAFGLLSPALAQDRKGDHRVAVQKHARNLVKEFPAETDLQKEDFLAYASVPEEVRHALLQLPRHETGLSDNNWLALIAHALRHDCSAHIRASVASQLARSDDKRTIALLREALGDRSGEVRLFACQSLMFQKDKSVASDVVKLLHDDCRDVRLTAVRTLGWLGDSAHVKPILDLYARDGGRVDDDWYFAEALAPLGEQAVSLKCVRNALQSGNWNVRYFAVASLTANRSDQVVPVIMDLLVPELKRTVDEMKTVRVGDRVLVGLGKELEKRTGQAFGADVLGWLEWWGQARDRYRAAAVAFDRVAVERLMEEYRNLQLPGQ